MKRQTKEFLYLIVIHLTALTLLMTLSGCATQSKSVGMGGLLGATGGALLGGIADPGKKGELRTRNVIVGAAVGGVAGMIAGGVIHDETDRQRKEAFEKGRASTTAPKSQSSIPSITSPRVETRWVEPKVSGNRYIEGHYEYIITEPTRWEDQ